MRFGKLQVFILLNSAVLEQPFLFSSCPARHRQRRSTGEVEVVWPHHNHDILERRKRGTLRKILEQRKEQIKKISTKIKPDEKYETEYLLPEYDTLNVNEK